MQRQIEKRWTKDGDMSWCIIDGPRIIAFGEPGSWDSAREALDAGYALSLYAHCKEYCLTEAPPVAEVGIPLTEGQSDGVRETSDEDSFDDFMTAEQQDEWCKNFSKPAETTDSSAAPTDPREYRFKTSEEAALLPLPLQLLRLKEINAELCNSHNTLLIENAQLERELKAAPKPPSPQEFDEELVSDEYISSKLTGYGDVSLMAKELQQRRNAARKAPSDQEMREIAEAAIATRIHGSDYRKGTHATALWKLVDAVLSKATGEVK